MNFLFCKKKEPIQDKTTEKHFGNIKVLLDDIHK